MNIRTFIHAYFQSFDAWSIRDTWGGIRAFDTRGVRDIRGDALSTRSAGKRCVAFSTLSRLNIHSNVLSTTLSLSCVSRYSINSQAIHAIAILTFFSHDIQVHSHRT